ncbi:MAG: hypothetical protein AAF598_14545 [Bacteroidota bacterium]
MVQRINLWSSPRNISTALMYSFANRTDCQVHDEPLYAHYLHVSGKAHPGRKEILKSQSQNGNQVIQDILLKKAPTKPVQLFKQMTHHLVQLNMNFLTEMKNVLLIRDPAEIIFSYGKVIDHIEMEDIGIAAQAELMEHLEKVNAFHGVLDAKELLLDPEKVLKQLCQQVDIPFEDRMLEWAAGAQPEDGVWAPYWYANVHRSRGFQTYRKRNVVLNPAQAQLNAICQPIYATLYECAIKA